MYDFHCKPMYILKIRMHWTRKYLAQLYSEESRCSDQTQHRKLRWIYAIALKKTKAHEYNARQIMRHDSFQKWKKDLLLKIVMGLLLFQLNIVSVSFDTSYVFFLAPVLAR